MTLRLRLTLLYGACFLAAGAALLAITYVLVEHETVAQQRSFVVRGVSAGVPRGALKGTVSFGVTGVHAFRAGGATIQRRVGSGPRPTAALIKATKADQEKINQIVARANGALRQQHTSSLDALLTWSGIALAIMALLSIGLGWLVAGRALRPLRTMNMRAREITAENLHERLGLDGRHDELGELASTFDAVLARLERAFTAQRRFVANASHELRTPLTLERALVEVALADPDADETALRRTCERVLASSEQQERVIDALLVLARGEAGVGKRQPVDLAAIVSRALPEAPSVEAELAPAVAWGDRSLLERLVVNLLDNAAVHNRPGGRIAVTTGVSDGRPALRVLNDGPRVPPDRLEEILEPFHRLAGERTGAGGLGLGLSIVRSIAEVHDAELEIRARPEGGLDVRVRLLPVAGSGATLQTTESSELLTAP